jgi:prepilin-type N-terminal cleavage/methylation domain-containing protein
MTQLTIKHPAPQGFSLVEMLVVIAVIGVIAAIAIPNIGSVGSSAKVATAQRNAQSIVSLY